MVPELSTVVFALVSSIVPAFVGWSLKRAVDGVDKSISNLAAKVDHLTAQDTKILVEVAELRARVVALEFVVLQKKG